jgi:hypothetical protein
MGGANGRLRGDRHIKLTNLEPTANLLLTFAELAQNDLGTIGHSTGKLSL